VKKRQGFLEKYYPEGDGDFFKNPKGLSLQAFECFLPLLRVPIQYATRPTIFAFSMFGKNEGISKFRKQIFRKVKLWCQIIIPG